MYSIVIVIFVQVIRSCLAKPADCNVVCPQGEMECTFIPKESAYKIFSSKCAAAAYSSCHNTTLIQFPLEYCLKNQNTVNRRRSYQEESCPVFCPNYYRPVCGAAKWRPYIYRTFNNGCYMDMVNCRGDEEFSAYVEVRLEFCHNHHMKNIFNERVVVTNLHEYSEYE